MPAHVVSATFEGIRGLSLVPGFRVRLPTDPGKIDHPNFVKGSGKNPSFLRLRDFIDSLVLAAEATLARDATAAPLAKGKAKLPEQVALRQHVGLPGAAAAGRARLAPSDVSGLYADAGVLLSNERIAKLVALVGGPLPDVPALVRTKQQPVPYLEAERLMLTSLSRGSLDALLRKPPEPSTPAPPKKLPLPAWHATYMRAAVEAATTQDERLQALAAMEALPHEQLPVSSSGDALERWWRGDRV